MGEVYRARDTRLERTVAVKVLPSRLSSDPELRRRFEREARAISQLSHPHICALYDVGREGETDFLVMEFLEGETLASRIAAGPAPGSDVPLRFADRRGAGARAPRRDRAPRPQAVQCDADEGRREATGLRSRAQVGGRRTRHGPDLGAHGPQRDGPDGTGRDRRDAPVHGPRAARGQGAGRTGPTSSRSERCSTRWRRGGRRSRERVRPR